jgi:holo-[acyl-carrier protein] synthase
MIGLGLDVVELDRFRRTLARTPSFAHRVFTADEVAYADGRRDPTERYAVRFAAKEAVLKAMSIGLWSCPLTDIEVVRAESGAPSLALHGRARELADEREVAQWHLTLCHTDRLAVALAVALGDGPPMIPTDAAELGRVVTAQLVEADVGRGRAGRG